MSYLFRIFFLLILFTHLYAYKQLQRNYPLHHNYVSLSDIVTHTKQDKKIFFIQEGRHSKRVKAKEVIKILNNLGYPNYRSQHSYIQFTQISPIKTTKIEQKLREAFLKAYKDIQIQKITITPRVYMTKLPAEYEVQLQKNSLLNSHGNLNIKTPQRKKIFFRYAIKARLDVLIAKNKMCKGDEISVQNTKKSTIILDKFRSFPLQTLPKSKYQAKHRIKKGTILTTRDVTGLFLVKRGDNVNLTIFNGGIQLSFLAKANQNGCYGDTITFTNSSGKKFKAVVIGKNRAEVK